LDAHSAKRQTVIVDRSYKKTTPQKSQRAQVVPTRAIVSTISIQRPAFVESRQRNPSQNGRAYQLARAIKTLSVNESAVQRY
jgi:hypothetical protein